MRFEFELTEADYSEAQAIVLAALHRRTPMSRVLGSIWIVATFVIYAILFNHFAPRKTVVGIPSVFGDVILPLIPWVSVLCYAAVFLYLRLRSRNVPWELSPAVIAKGARRGGWAPVIVRGILFLLYGVAMAAFASWMIRLPQVPGLPYDDRSGGWMLLGVCIGAMAWYVYSFWSGILALIARGSSATSWTLQRHLHGVQEMNFADDGITVRAPLVRSAYAWKSFIGFLETQNLFLLLLTPSTYVIVPRRTLPEATQLDELRALLSSRIGTGKFLARPAGFPVMPAAGVA